MLKFQELQDPNSCLNKAALDEPVFVLRAKDPIAAQVIEFWAEMAEHAHESSKITKAKTCAQLFREWRQKNIIRRD